MINNETFHNMETDAINETTDISAQNESNHMEETIQFEFHSPPPTESFGIQEPVDRSSDRVIHESNAIVSHDGKFDTNTFGEFSVNFLLIIIYSGVSRDAENQLVKPDECHSTKNRNKSRVKRNNIWANQKSWREHGASISYANRDVIIYSDGEYYFCKCVFLHLIFYD